MYQQLETDILILGGGGAGLLAALHARRANQHLRIAVAAKGLVGQSGCTRMVQGGYNAVMDPKDTFDLHFEDTIRGGAFINNQELAWVLVNNAPLIISELEQLGCFFDRDAQGHILQKAFAGQSFDRTVHRGDLTGIEIMSRLKENVLMADLTLLDEQRAISLLKDENGGVGGALLLDIRSGEFTAVNAKATLMATGGGARMYTIAAPSLEKCGDGMALCYRAGCTLQDMEMYQFHPTGLVAGETIITGSVLEEGLRGAGGYLLNALGERFMERYDPQRMERSTRDMVSRAGYMEIQAGRGTPDGAVLLDVSHLGAEFVERTFPGMAARCREVGFDLGREPVKVSPTAHFHMGGVRIDQLCRSGLDGLFVAGEDSGGVHGANRLGGNGVAESTVFGALAGDAMAEFASDRSQPVMHGKQIDDAIGDAIQPMGRDGGENIHSIRKEIESLMWDKGGIVRSGLGLEEALASLEGLAQRAGAASVPAIKVYNMAWQEWLDVQSILTVAQLTCQSALARRESRGSHYRSDYPEPDDGNWLCNVLVQQDSGPSPRVWQEDVDFTRMRP